MTQDFEYVLDMLEVHKELQESVIRDIVRRIVKNAGKMTDTAAWQAECAQESGVLLNDIIKWSARASKTLKKEIRQAFDDAETKVFDYDDAVVEAAGFDPVEFKSISPEMADIWNATLSKTSTVAVNLTKTIAVTSQTKYIQACDLASMQVSSGAFSYDTAIRNAIKSAAAQGVSVIYPSGWVDGLDVAIRRSVLTGVNQTAGQLQMMRAGELDNDIMEITAHAGARLEHAIWQGKLVSLSGKKGYLTLRDIGYGDVRGFMGANCRHNWHIFFVGISTPAYTPAQLEDFKNETVTYNGKDIPLWKANDRQRAMERDIKAKKRQLVAIDEALKNTDDEVLKSGLNADFESLAVKLKSQEAKLKDFCKQTDIARQPSREQVFSVKTEKAIKYWGKSVSQKAVWSNKKAVDNLYKDDIIKSTKPITEVHNLQYIGKIDKNLYQRAAVNNILSDEVIITDNRIQHIIDRRGQAFYDEYSPYFSDIISNPDYIFKDKSDNTAIAAKTFTHNNTTVNLVVRLIVEGENSEFKNSILTAIKENKKRFKQRLRNNEYIYKKFDKSE